MPRLCLFFLFLLPCLIQAQVIEKYKDNGFSFTVTVDTFPHADFDSTEFFTSFKVRSIEISKGAQSEVVQTIYPEMDDIYDREDEIGETLSFEDINFDGIKDIYVRNYVGMYWGTYNFWVYDKDSAKYVYVPILCGVNWPDMDQKNKRIHSSWRCGLSEFGHAVFGWEGKECVLLKKEVLYEHTNWNKETKEDIVTYSYHTITRINGENVEKKEDLGKDEGPMPYHRSDECWLLK